MNGTTRLQMRFVSGVALAGTLAGCVAQVDGPRHREVYIPPPPPVREEYVYYPSHQVYYSSTRHQYVYLEGRSWVTRPAPPRVSVDVLVASPSVRLDFHDAPSAYHSRVVRQYPRNWSPPGWHHGHKEDPRRR